MQMTSSFSVFWTARCPLFTFFPRPSLQSPPGHPPPACPFPIQDPSCHLLSPPLSPSQPNPPREWLPSPLPAPSLLSGCHLRPKSHFLPSLPFSLCQSHQEPHAHPPPGPPSLWILPLCITSTLLRHSSSASFLWLPSLDPGLFQSLVVLRPLLLTPPCFHRLPWPPPHHLHLRSAGSGLIGPS